MSASLRAAGLRATGPRLAVLDALTALGGHRSADEIHDALRAAGTDLARASVYNALRDLVQARVALVADLGPGVARYEAAGAFHHHFVCRCCATVIDVECVADAAPCLRPTPTPETATAIAEVDEA